MGLLVEHQDILMAPPPVSPSRPYRASAVKRLVEAFKKSNIHLTNPDNDYDKEPRCKLKTYRGSRLSSSWFDARNRSHAHILLKKTIGENNNRADEIIKNVNNTFEPEGKVFHSEDEGKRKTGII